MKLYKVQDLGLPDRWNNFTVFSSEVSRLVLLSERGRTHGSIWGVPPFLEGVLRATVATTVTTSYFYSFNNDDILSDDAHRYDKAQAGHV